MKKQKHYKDNVVNINEDAIETWSFTPLGMMVMEEFGKSYEKGLEMMIQLHMQKQSNLYLSPRQRNNELI